MNTYRDLSSNHITLENEELQIVRLYLEEIVRSIKLGTVHRLRVGIDGEGLKFKINEGVWSPGIETRPGDDE